MIFVDISSQVETLNQTKLKEIKQSLSHFKKIGIAGFIKPRHQNCIDQLVALFENAVVIDLKVDHTQTAIITLFDSEFSQAQFIKEHTQIASDCLSINALVGRPFIKNLFQSDLGQCLYRSAQFITHEDQSNFDD